LAQGPSQKLLPNRVIASDLLRLLHHRTNPITHEQVHKVEEANRVEKGADRVVQKFEGTEESIGVEVTKLIKRGK